MFLQMRVIGWVCLLLGCSCVALADVQLPKLVSSGMVLQRDAEIKIWGWAEPGEQVSVSFNKVNLETATDSDGKWQVRLPAMSAGGPFTMRIEGNNVHQLEDVLIGDVWLASGQSNMELTLARAEPRFPELVANIHNLQIRQFEVPDRYHFAAEQFDLESGHWQEATQDNIRQFSAVAYFFAEKIQSTEQVPIGIINASLGGSPVEAWISENTLKKFPEPYKEALRFRSNRLIDQIIKTDQANMNAWFTQLDKADTGYQDSVYLWADPQLDTKDWRAVDIPGYWAKNEVSGEDGVVWFRRTVNLSAELAKQNALLVLGAIVDADQVFVNGRKIGETTYMYPPRRYEVPGDVLKVGDNTIAVRVISQKGRGGFVPDKEYALNFASHSIDLRGQWQFKRGATMARLASQTFIRWTPLGLYNAMIAPLTNVQIKGVIWYQGESNAGNAESYGERFPAMIRDWRHHFGQGNFPFLFVQLANYVGPGQPRDQIGSWPELREAQTRALALPNTAMVVAIDAGEWNDIHPLDKQTIGHRLAAAAEHLAYGKDRVYAGPALTSAVKAGNKVALSFTHLGTGLSAKGGPLDGFELAGADGQFHRAKAKIRGAQVVVWSEQVAKPTAVRYAWANNPEAANLYNKEGFPAGPFRSDISAKR